MENCGKNSIRVGCICRATWAQLTSSRGIEARRVRRCSEQCDEDFVTGTRKRTNRRFGSYQPRATPWVHCHKFTLQAEGLLNAVPGCYDLWSGYPLYCCVITMFF